MGPGNRQGLGIGALIGRQRDAETGNTQAGPLPSRAAAGTYAQISFP